MKDFRSGSDRKLQLRRCPECGTPYLFQTDYDFCVNGSEDEQALTRLADAEAAEYLKQ